MSCTCDIYQRYGTKAVWHIVVNPNCSDHAHLLNDMPKCKKCGHVLELIPEPERELEEPEWFQIQFDEWFDAVAYAS